MIGWLRRLTGGGGLADQVRNGVAVRMAVLYLLLGSGVDLKPEVISG